MTKPTADRSAFVTAVLASSAAIGSAFTPPAFAQTPPPGERVYKETCFACHATGEQKAPKFGDKKAWAPLIKEGQARLTADGWLGVRAMPPKGGNASLSLEDFASATAHMARAGGAKWTDPDGPMLERIRAEERKLLARRKAKP